MSTGIVIDNSTDGVIEGITITGFEVGIDLKNSKNITIDGVKFRDATSPAIIENAKNIKLQGNVIISKNNNQSGPSKLSGIAELVIANMHKKYKK